MNYRKLGKAILWPPVVGGAAWALLAGIAWAGKTVDVTDGQLFIGFILLVLWVYLSAVLYEEVLT